MSRNCSENKSFLIDLGLIGFHFSISQCKEYNFRQFEQSILTFPCNITKVFSNYLRSTWLARYRQNVIQCLLFSRKTSAKHGALHAFTTIWIKKYWPSWIFSNKKTSFTRFTVSDTFHMPSYVYSSVNFLGNHNNIQTLKNKQTIEKKIQISNFRLSKLFNCLSHD